jgi:DNA-directed RNA polymerase subunit RPC12/RpoP
VKGLSRFRLWMGSLSIDVSCPECAGPMESTSAYRCMTSEAKGIVECEACGHRFLLAVRLTAAPDDGEAERLRNWRRSRARGSFGVAS